MTMVLSTVTLYVGFLLLTGGTGLPARCGFGSDNRAVPPVVRHLEKTTMDENNTQEQPASSLAAAHGHSEEVSDLREEPDQQRRAWDRTCLARNERIRLLVLGLGLLALLAGFLIFLFSRTVLPLFGTMVVVFVGYRRLDAWLDRTERSRY